MQNLTKQQQIIAKIVSAPGDPVHEGARDCALMRLARANGHSAHDAWLAYASFARVDEGLTSYQVTSVMAGWDTATNAFPDTHCSFKDREWFQVGVDAARACGLATPEWAADPEQDPTPVEDPVDEPVPPVEDDHLTRSRAVTRPIRKHAPVNRVHERFDVSDVAHQAWEAAFARAPGKVPA